MIFEMTKMKREEVKTEVCIPTSTKIDDFVNDKRKWPKYSSGGLEEKAHILCMLEKYSLKHGLPSSTWAFSHLEIDILIT